MRITTHVRRLAAATSGVLALCGLVVAAASGLPAPQTTPGDPLDPRTYAPASEVFLVAHAAGVQKYTCRQDGTWVFTDPEATLYSTTGGANEIGTHFLDFATGRPVWRAKDGSSVEATRRAAAAGGLGNIPWLLLETVVSGVGGDGDRLARTTWVQRLDTTGGVAPSGSCTPGSGVAVPYSADYAFWRTARADASNG